MMAKSAFPLIAGSLLVATFSLATAQQNPFGPPVAPDIAGSSGQIRIAGDSESETLYPPAPAEPVARGAAVVQGGTGTATSTATGDTPDPGSRSASGTAITSGSVDTAGAEASASNDDGTAFGAGEIDNASGSASGSVELGPTGVSPLTGSATGEAIINSATGSATAASGVTIGDLSTGGGAGTDLGGTDTSSVSDVSDGGPTDFFATTTAWSRPTGATIGFLPDQTFSFSNVQGTSDGTIGVSEAWKGDSSGSAFSESDAGNGPIFTMGASGGEAGVGPMSSFSQAIWVPSDSEPPLFASAIGESTDGLATYSLSLVARATGTDPVPPAGALSVSLFDGNGSAHADGLAGLTYGEADISNAIDAQTLIGTASSSVDVVDPIATVDSVIQVEGSGGGAFASTSFVSVELESVQDVAQDFPGVAANTVVLNKTLQGNTIVEDGGSRANDLQASGLNVNGILDINQDSGIANNEANVRSIAWSDVPGALLMNQVTGSVSTVGNTLNTGGGTRTDLIDGSFQGGTGIVGVNQTAGSLNQLNNVLALAIGLDGTAAAISDASLGTVHSDNTRVEDPASEDRSDTISGSSFQGFTGIAQVNQSAGDLNQINSTVLVTVTMQ
jgi:hypothetical protein